MDTAVTLHGNDQEAAPEPARSTHDGLVEYARHERGYCSAAGLFTPQNGERRIGRKLDLTVPGPHGGTLRFWGPEPLTGFDLLVLQGLVAYAGVHGIDLNEPAASQPEQTLRTQLSLALEGAAVQAAERAPKLYFATSYYRFAREIGVNPQTNHHYSEALRRSLERLYSVTMIAEADGTRVSTRLISTMALSTRNGALAIALNTTVSQAIVGGGQFTRIPMPEVRALRHDVTRILHQHLCALLFEDGKGHRFRFTTLLSYVYPPDRLSLSERAERKRAAALRDALGELVELGWRIDADANGIYRITRPVREDYARGRRPAAHANA